MLFFYLSVLNQSVRWFSEHLHYVLRRMLKGGDIRGMTLFTEVIIVASEAFITNASFGCDIVFLTTIAGNDDLFRIRLRRILLVDGGI